MKSSKVIIALAISVLAIGGGVALFTVRNTFTIENSAATVHQPVVYVTSEDLNTTPEELVAPELETTLVRVLPNEVGYLNVRKGPGTSNARVTQVNPGDEFEYIEIENNWYHIVISADETGWVSGQYIEEI